MSTDTPQFVSLHNHSDHSLLDGFGKTFEYVKIAKDLGHPGVGLTDHGSLAGIAKMYNSCKAEGIIFVPGCEFYVAPENPLGAEVKEPVFYGNKEDREARKDVSGGGAYLHLSVWAVTNEGLHNLYKLSSYSNRDENTYRKPRIDFKMLEEHSEGLVVSTGCPSSEISTRFRLGQDDKAYDYARRLLEVFGKDRLFVEIMDHSMNIELERELLVKQVKLAQDLGIELLATNDCHYGKKEDAPVHEEFLAIQTKSSMATTPTKEGGSRFSFDGNEYFFKTAEQMLEIFPEKDYPRAVSNTVKIAEMAKNITMEYDPNLRPIPKLPEGFKTEKEYLVHLIKQNIDLPTKYGNASPEVKKQARANVNKELKVLESSDYIGYILIVAEYMNWIRDNYSVRDDDGNVLALPVGVARGSGGGSTICFILNITEIDPIRHDLIFERFLSEGRGNSHEFITSSGEAVELVASHKVIVLRDQKVKEIYAHQIKNGDVLVDWE